MINPSAAMADPQHRLLSLLGVPHSIYIPELNSVEGPYEILSTFRYDPRFTHVFTRDGVVHYMPLDESLQLRCLAESPTDFIGGCSVPSPDFFSTVRETLQKQSTLQHYEEPSFREMMKQRFLLLEDQFQRLQVTLSFFQINNTMTIDDVVDRLIEAVCSTVEPKLNSTDEKTQKKVLANPHSYKIRALIALSGELKIEVHPLSKQIGTWRTPTEYFTDTILNGIFKPSDTTLPLPWRVYLNEKPITRSPFTSFKTTHRCHYNQARDLLKLIDLGPSEKKEILLHNEEGEVMEGSITNVAFKIDGRWITPSLSSGCLLGVMRHYLLRVGIIQEGDIYLEELRHEQSVLLFNGVIGVVQGKLVMRKP